MTCKDCLHYQVCAEEGTYFTDEYIKGITVNNDVKSLCVRFANRKDYTKVKHGHWIGKLFDWGSEEEYPILEKSHYLVCSKCGHKHFLYIYDFFGRLHKCSTSDVPIIIPNGCPNCLAKMDEGKKNEL